MQVSMERINTSDTADGAQEQRIKLALVGCVVPESEANRSEYTSFNWAGNMFQLRLMQSLRDNGVSPDAVFSGRPVHSFPTVRRLWFGLERVESAPGECIEQLSFFNFGPLKTLTLGVSTVVALARWGRRQHKAAQRTVLCYNVYSPHGLAVLLGARLARAKAVALMADIMVPGHGIGNSPLRWLDFHMQTWSMRHFDGLITLTPTMARDFAPEVESIQMEGALPEDVAVKLAALPESELCRDGVHTVFYAGHLGEVRGVDLLLEAFGLVEGENYRLVIVGTGPLKDKVVEAAQRDSRISYLGYLDTYEEVLAKYADSSILVSLYRPSSPASSYIFPSKLIEYLATGRPTIATPTPGVEEEYGDCLFLLRDETPQALAELIRRVAGLSAAERDELSRRSRELVLGHKTWRRQGRRIVDFIGRLCGLGGNGGSNGL